jgi:hypothetical protein
MPSLQSLRAALPAAAPLGLALAAALVGHGLFLAPNPWRRNPAPAQVLTAEDNTPELLRFSRRMPQEVAATTIPLPPATTLPPPPPDLLGPLPNKDAATAKAPAAATAKAGAPHSEAKSSKIQRTLLLKPSKASSPGAHGGGTAPSLARKAGAITTNSTGVSRLLASRKLRANVAATTITAPTTAATSSTATSRPTTMVAVG